MYKNIQVRRVNGEVIEGELKNKLIESELADGNTMDMLEAFGLIIENKVDELISIDTSKWT